MHRRATRSPSCSSWWSSNSRTMPPQPSPSVRAGHSPAAHRDHSQREDVDQPISSDVSEERTWVLRSYGRTGPRLDQLNEAQRRILQSLLLEWTVQGKISYIIYRQLYGVATLGADGLLIRSSTKSSTSRLQFTNYLSTIINHLRVHVYVPETVPVTPVVHKTRKLTKSERKGK